MDQNYIFKRVFLPNFPKMYNHFHYSGYKTFSQQFIRIDISPKNKPSRDDIKIEKRERRGDIAQY